MMPTGPTASPCKNIIHLEEVPAVQQHDIPKNVSSRLQWAKDLGPLNRSSYAPTDIFSNI